MRSTSGRNAGVTSGVAERRSLRYLLQSAIEKNIKLDLHWEVISWRILVASHTIYGGGTSSSINRLWIQSGNWYQLNRNASKSGSWDTSAHSKEVPVSIHEKEGINKQANRIDWVIYTDEERIWRSWNTSQFHTETSGIFSELKSHQLRSSNR